MVCEEEEEEEEEAAMHQSVVVRHCSGRGVEADIPGALGWSVEEEEEEEEEEASVEAALLGMGEVAVVEAS